MLVRKTQIGDGKGLHSIEREEVLKGRYSIAILLIQVQHRSFDLPCTCFAYMGIREWLI